MWRRNRQQFHDPASWQRFPKLAQDNSQLARSIPGRADADAGCQLGEVPAIDVAEKRAILAGLSETSRSGREPVAPP